MHGPLVAPSCVRHCLSLNYEQHPPAPALFLDLYSHKRPRGNRPMPFPPAIRRDLSHTSPAIRRRHVPFAASYDAITRRAPSCSLCSPANRLNSAAHNYSNRLYSPTSFFKVIDGDIIGEKVVKSARQLLTIVCRGYPSEGYVDQCYSNKS